MKRLIVLFLVVALLLLAAAPAAAEPYRRVVIPVVGVSVALQPLALTPEGWEEPNHEAAWFLRPWPQAVFLHRGGPGAKLDRLGLGNIVFLYKDWGLENRPLQLRVTEVEVIPEDEEPVVLGMVGGDVFALITCHPPGSSEAPERLIVWLEIDHGPRWAYVQWGDCLSEIARRYGVSVETIARENAIADPNHIRAGTWLRIP